MTLEEAIRILRSPAGKDETKRVYYLRCAVDWAEITIRSGLSRADAEELVDAVASRAEELFPGSADTFAIVYGVRLRRVMEEVYGKLD